MVVLTSFSAPSEDIEHEQPSTTLYISGQEIGCGTLYIAKRKLCWRNNATGEGFSLLYPCIAVHAISKDIARFGAECLFIKVDTCLKDTDMNGEVEDSENENEGNMTEMIFVPDDKGQLQAMFQAMAYCQSQHPDAQDAFSEDDEYLDADEEGEHTFEAADSGCIEDRLERSNGFSEDEGMETDGQFEDAEDD